MHRIVFALTFGAALAGHATLAAAATSIDFMLQQAGQTGDIAQTAYIDQGRILIRGAGGDPAMDLLFQQAGETMTVINHLDKTTLDIDAAKVATLTNQIGGMMDIVKQQVAKQMENMSEQEREKLEQMLANMGGGSLLPAEQAPAPARTYKGAGARTINGFDCEQTDVYEGENKVSEVCTAEPGDLGIPTTDSVVIDAMQAMSRKLIDQTARISEQMGQNIPQFGDAEVPGIPVRMTDEAGNSMTITRIQSGIGDASLDKPEGYAVKPMPGLPQLTQ